MPTAIPAHRATRARVIESPTAVPSATPTTPPRLTPAQAPSNVDPYAAFYATERDGIYVTSRNARARYFYKWDDHRWFGVDDRVWFRTTEELMAVFPGRVAAP
ncbi:MAG: hypothetical protein EPO26_00455 [Chloroflexota bacterium]|nr:MAG: hypothetical protein EPO26_00455 [Chloroflexota bacterium]